MSTWAARLTVERYLLKAFLISQFCSCFPIERFAAIMETEWEKERTFEIEKVSPIYLVTALCVVPFGIYFLLNFLSPLIHRITAMKIAEVYFRMIDDYGFR